jgi:zinc-binding alcohol dehydrogenase family protein
MKAVVQTAAHPIEHPESLVDVELPDPTPGAHDLLVRVEAISVNPVDHKIRAGVTPDGPRVLGWDAVGVVEDVGDAVRGFERGQRVWYAGDLERAGSNSELQCVDARLVSLAPVSLTPSEAAALPLTAITAWEILFERLNLPLSKVPNGQVLLVSGAAGGVGSILVQLAARLTAATVVATSGRPASRAWVEGLGAHHVISYREPLGPQLQALGIGEVTHIASLTHTEHYFAQFVEILAPFGHFSLDVVPMKVKSQSLHWELMFTRSLFGAGLAAQGGLLSEVAALVDAGVLRSTMTRDGGVINAANLQAAHAALETGGGQGKLVLTGFGS